MLIALNLIAAVAALPIAQEPPRQERDVRVVVVGDGGGPASLDKDEDGFVSREEFSGPVTEAFATLDRDGDGRLSEDELKGGAPDGPMILHHGGPGFGALRRFELDHDGPGESDVFIVRTPGGHEHREHRIIVHGLGEGAGPMGEGRIHVRSFGGGSMDRDGDGRVTREEFMAPLADAFGRLDKDGSGALEEDESGDD